MMAVAARARRGDPAADARRELATTLFGLSFDAGGAAFVAHAERGEVLVANARLAAWLGEHEDALVGRPVGALIRAEVDAGGGPMADPLAAPLAAPIADPLAAPEGRVIVAGRRAVLACDRVYLPRFGALVAARLAAPAADDGEPAALAARIAALGAELAEAARQAAGGRFDPAAVRAAHAAADGRSRAVIAQLRADVVADAADAAAALAAAYAAAAGAVDALAAAPPRAELARLVARGRGVVARLTAQLTALREAPP